MFLAGSFVFKARSTCQLKIATVVLLGRLFKTAQSYKLLKEVRRR